MNGVTIWASTPLLLYYGFLAALFGACMGSFLNCAAWRMARGESFLRGRSHCPACGHTLNAADLIPVFGWLFLRGRCRYCGAAVPVRYPLTELAFAALTTACLLRFDITLLCLRNYIFLCCLFCLSLTDLDSFLIPDGCLILPAAVWILTAPAVMDGWTPVRVHLLTGLGMGGLFLFLSLIMDRILGRESLGGGDIKLFAVTGLYLGPAASLLAVLLSCVLGLAAIPAFRRAKGAPFPFGPAISAAAAYMLLYGEPLTAWYLRMSGL